MIYRFCFATAALLSSFLISAHEPIKLITGLPKPPYIMADGQSGMQLDMVKAALACEKIEVEFVNVPASRNITSYQSLNADGLVTLPSDFKYPNLFLTESYIQYKNVVVTLADTNITINNFLDLEDLSTAAFQNAREYLPDDYAKAVDIAIDYREVADQTEQVDMLFSHRVEAIVLDLSIFKHTVLTSKNPLYKQAFIIHQMFEPTTYSAGFNEQKLQAAFKKGMQCIKKSGEHKEIVNRYI